MKMCLKLAYSSFASSPSKDDTMSTFCVLFLHFFLKFKQFDEFFPSKTSLKFLCVARACVCVCVCGVRPLNKDVSQAIIALFQCLFQCLKKC